MATVLDEITVALKELGVLAETETPTAEAAADALAALNRMVDQWAAERLQIFTVTRTTWTITSGTQNYAVGTGQVVNVARPVFVDHINYLDTSPTPDLELPLAQFTEDGWAGLPDKAQTSPQPTSFYYNPTYPYGLISLWPVPTGTTLQGVLYAPQAVAAFATLATAVALPPGYEEAICTNLAVRLAASYEKQIDSTLYERAKEAKAIVKRANRRPMDMQFERSAMVGGGHWDIRTGQ